MVKDNTHKEEDILKLNKCVENFKQMFDELNNQVFTIKISKNIPFIENVYTKR